MTPPHNSRKFEELVSRDDHLTPVIVAVEEEGPGEYKVVLSGSTLWLDLRPAQARELYVTLRRALEVTGLQP